MNTSKHIGSLIGVILFVSTLFAETQTGFTTDLNQDHRVDFKDLGVLAENWLWTGRVGEISADLLADGQVDFADFSCMVHQWHPNPKSVAVFVDVATYEALPHEIDRLTEDIERDLNVQVQIHRALTFDIQGIKTILQQAFEYEGLIGTILIGDIPTSYSEYNNSGYTPSDWYFEDLSNQFFDTDGDGRFESEFRSMETDITMRDIWCGRIKPPVGGANGIAQLKRYLDRNHAYRTGELIYPKQMMYYHSVALNQSGMSQSDYLDLANGIAAYTGLYEPNDTVYSLYAESLTDQKALYLETLAQPWEICFVNVHGSPWSQWLGEAVYVDHEEIEAVAPQALFTILASCSNGDFTRQDYLAGSHLFSGQSLVVMANSTVTMLVGGQTLDFLRDYIPLGLGVTFGDMHLNDLSGSTHHLLGDPTLRLRVKPTGPVPDITVSQTQLDFNEVPLGQQPIKNVEFTNQGTGTAHLQFKKGRFSIDGESAMLGYWDVFQYLHPDTGSTFRSFDIGPGQTKTVPFVFYPRPDAPTGHYSMKILFQTNDPSQPYLTIDLQGQATTP